MKLPRTILLILSLSASGCESSPLFYPSSASSASVAVTSYSSWASSTRQRRHVAFMVVPRGGGAHDDVVDESFSESEDANDDYIHDDDSIIDQSDYGDDVTAHSTDEDCVVSDNNEQDDDDDHLPSIDPNILSPTHLTSLFVSAAHHRQSLTSAMVHYATVLLQATRRACLAGARAVMSMNDDDDGEVNYRGNGKYDESEERRGSGGKKPMVHTLIGRTIHVIEVMYHAVTSDDVSEVGAENVEVDDDDEGSQSIQDEVDDQVNTGTKHSRRRRRHQRRHNGKKRHHRKHHPHQPNRHITTPPKAIKVISNGGGMDPPPPSSNYQDAILQLAKLYNTKLPTNDDAHQTSLSKKYDCILLSSQTPINEAMQLANSNARFLICYISKQIRDGSSSNSNKSNAIAIPNLLSPEIVKLANRKALGKKQTGDYASFYIWIANDDAHVDAAMKRLGVKPLKRQSSTKKKKSKSDSDDPPILAIIYPATTIDPSSGRPRISSRILAQHHCNPPPTTCEILTSWANTVRKRHLRDYAKMQHACKELQLLQERNRGYVGSIQEDEAREVKEVKERQFKEEEEANERDRLRQLEERRQVLLESLAEEPPVVGTPPEDVITIALRFSDGSNKRDQRRFLAETTSINDVCNWIDATHGIEREKLELTTMNGARKFVYAEDDEKDMTLREAGLAKMTALRVVEVESVAVKNEENEVDDEKDDEEKEGAEEEGNDEEEDDEDDEDEEEDDDEEE